MTASLRLHPAADEELSDAADYYDREGPGLGAALLADVERAAREIVEFPEACPLVREPVRMKRLGRFPFAIMYSRDDEEILVLALAHERRRPFYWGDRL